MKRTMLVVVTLLLCTALFAQTAKKTAPAPAAAAAHHTMMMDKDLKWSALAPGYEMTVVSGNPDATGPYVLRIRATKDHAEVPPHWHPGDESITILSGTFKVGEGDKTDEKATHTLQAGDFAMMPAKVHHFAISSKDCVVQVHGMGPFKVNWVNPPEAPKATKK